jgi:hypothetical protein
MMAIDGGEWFAEHWLLWTLPEVVEQNLWFRGESGKEAYERDFRKVVFFAHAGSDVRLPSNGRSGLCAENCRLVSD